MLQFRYFFWLFAWCWLLSFTESIAIAVGDIQSEAVPLSLPLNPFDQNVKKPTLGIQLDLGLTYDFASAMDALMNTKGSALILQDVLRNRYGSDQESFSKVKIAYFHVPLIQNFDLFRDLYVELAGEFVFWGVAHNPVLAELHGKIIWLGTLTAGFTGSIPTLPIATKIGLVVGRGLGRTLNVISPDLVSATRPINEDLQLYGVDLAAFSSSHLLDDTIEVGSTFEYRWSVYFSNINDPIFVNRWKSISHIESLTLTQLSGVRIQPHITFGKQPFPYEILPRGWDYIHQLNIPDNLFSWSGIGTDIFLESDKALKCTFGIYGGLFGASLSYQLESFTARLGSWAMSVGNQDQDTERFWQASLGFQF